MCHHLFHTIRSCFSHVLLMIDTGGVVQGEKNARLKEIRLTLINGLCLCKYEKIQKCKNDAYLSLSFLF